MVSHMMEMELSQSHGELLDESQWFEAAVAEYRESSSRVEGLGLRPLGTGLKIVIWVLRFYVLFMVVVVIFNIVQTIH